MPLLCWADFKAQVSLKSLVQNLALVLMSGHRFLKITGRTAVVCWVDLKDKSSVRSIALTCLDILTIPLQARGVEPMSDIGPCEVMFIVPVAAGADVSSLP